jgi:hypothetical protein
MPIELELVSQINTWLSDDDASLEVQALLALPEPQWVKVIAFKDAGETLQITYRGLSLSLYLDGDVELVCASDALKAVRRKKVDSIDPLDATLEVSDDFLEMVDRAAAQLDKD